MAHDKEKVSPDAATPGETFTIDQVIRLFRNISSQVDGLEIHMTIKSDAGQPLLKPNTSAFRRGRVM